MGIVSVPARGCGGDGEPAVGFGGEVGAEAEGLGQGQGRAAEGGHDVAGAAPLVDGLGGVSDHDELGVVALGVEDLFDDGVGVLGFVEEEEVRGDSRFGQCPDLEVVVMVEADGAGVGVLEVGPCCAGEGQDQGGEFAVVAGVFEVAQSGDVVVGEGGVRRVAEAGDGAQRRVGEGAG